MRCFATFASARVTWWPSRNVGRCSQPRLWVLCWGAVCWGHLMMLLLSPGGKTIVGGLLGGWLGVEIVKRSSGIHRRTGDLVALPLCVGIAVGRIGCLLAGLADDTFGKPTSLPWAVDLGDGIGRHPVQVYEILFLILLGLMVSTRAKLPEGARFRIFLGGYLAWRLVIDFLKPQPLIDGMNLIQWSCVGGILLLILDEIRPWTEMHDTAKV